MKYPPRIRHYIYETLHEFWRLGFTYLWCGSHLQAHSVKTKRWTSHTRLGSILTGMISYLDTTINVTSCGALRTTLTYLRCERVIIPPHTHNDTWSRIKGHHEYKRDHQRIPVNVTYWTRTDQHRSWFDTNGQGMDGSHWWWYSFNMSSTINWHCS